MTKPSTSGSDRLRLIGRGALAVAVVAIAALAVFLVREVRKTPTAPPVRERVSDVVSKPTPPRAWWPKPNAEPGSAPRRAPEVKEIPVPPERQLKPVTRVMPHDLPDPSRPPQYTKIKAGAPKNPVPPNPHAPPPLDMNPDRKAPPY